MPTTITESVPLSIENILGRGLSTWCAPSAMEYTFPRAETVWAIVPNLPIPSRKLLVDYCRVQPPVRQRNHPFFNKHRADINKPIIPPPGVPNAYSSSVTIHNLLNSLAQAYHETTLFYSTFLQILLECPYDDYQSVIEAREQAIQKELRAATTIYHPVELDYYFLKRNLEPRLIRPLAYNIPVCEEIGKVICRAFDSFLPPSLCPRLSTKTPHGQYENIALLLNDRGVSGDYGIVERVYLEPFCLIISVEYYWK